MRNFLLGQQMTVAVSFLVRTPDYDAIFEYVRQRKTMTIKRTQGCLQRPPGGDSVGDPRGLHKNKGFGGVFAEPRLTVQQSAIQIENN